MTQRNTGSEWFQCHPPKETHSMGMGTIWLSRFNIFMEGTIDDNMNTTRLTLKEPVGWRTRRIGWRKLQLTGGFVNEYCILGVDWSKREFHKELSGFHQSAEKQLYAPRPPPKKNISYLIFSRGQAIHNPKTLPITEGLTEGVSQRDPGHNVPGLKNTHLAIEGDWLGERWGNRTKNIYNKGIFNGVV